MISSRVGWICVLVAAATSIVAGQDASSYASLDLKQPLQRNEETPANPTNTAVSILQSHYEPLGGDRNARELESWSETTTGDSEIDDTSTDLAKAHCAEQTTCTECTALSGWCHWCNDGACHAKGSPYGCFAGNKCSDDDNNNDDDDDHGSDDNNNDDNDDNHGSDNDKNHCNSHSTCSECALSSSFCHWCAHDNACHAKGSPFGCFAGVDCFSNDRCRRLEPTSISEFGVRKMKLMPLVGILTITFVLACCATACFCCVHGIKGAYDDLLLPGEEEMLLSEEEQNIVQEHMQNSDDDQLGNEAQNTTPLLPQTASSSPEEDVVPAETRNKKKKTKKSQAENDSPTSTETNNDYEQLVDIEEQPQSQQPRTASPERSTSRVSSAPSRRPRHMKRMYNVCAVCYVLAVAIIAVFAFGSIRYYPKMPEYNICNDRLAWKKLFEHMAKMKGQADIEILASVANYNSIDAALDEGGGTFAYEGDLVGTFDIPPVTVQAKSVTDIMIVAHFTPETWQALKIGAQYAQGKLVLEVDAEGTIRIPALFNYSFHGKFENLVVHVNELSDRHYCHCPSWDEAKNDTHVESFMLDLPGF